MKSTTLNIARSQAVPTNELPQNVGRHPKRVDAALPGKHTRQLRINAIADKQTVEHFLFRCRKWTAHRTELLQCTQTHRGNISFALGGKQPSDDQKWTPSLEAVRASIRFAIATGRLEAT
ncbi:hypothetical protein N7478_010717 [Penicillium angulare]|uniref:uncharacterized protein n=1 Tax=Penicillium angulare TaxID=116970 RepID=UPI002540036D|nr:uncharacterized protein N7478_010717 [Penicillium angulare]KAJ5267909.1 hypothetical protein N7478_010717 [Penicillium angulare]